jgi:hypothetical protein
VGDQLSRQPGDRFQNEITREVEQVLSHTQGKGPGWDPFVAYVIGKVDERGIIIVHRVAAGVLVKEKGVAKKKVAKEQ